MDEEKAWDDPTGDAMVMTYNKVSTGKEPLTYPQLAGGVVIALVLIGSLGYVIAQIVRAVWS